MSLRRLLALAFPGRVELDPAFTSFFAEPDSQARTTARALDMLAGWIGPGMLVAVTHQVNITALTGVVPGESEGVVIRMQGRAPAVVGRLPL